MRFYSQCLDKLYIDFSELDEKNYHNGIRFTFFAKNVRGEIASGGRYHIHNNNINVNNIDMNYDSNTHTDESNIILNKLEYFYLV